jgi:DNA-binding GntR family transcriptional regulator
VSLSEADVLNTFEVMAGLEGLSGELAAQRITDAELESLHIQVEELREAHRVQDLARFVAADLAFHDEILHASEIVFVAVLFEPLHRVLEKRRTETSQVPAIQEHAIGHHQGIYDALAARDPRRARDAMDAHMQQTLDDLRSYVLEA